MNSVGSGNLPNKCKPKGEMGHGYSAHRGLLGAELVVKSDSSRKEGPVIPLLISLSLKEVPSAVMVSCRGLGLLHRAVMTTYPSPCSLPALALVQAGIQEWSRPS